MRRPLATILALAAIFAAGAPAAAAAAQTYTESDLSAKIAREMRLGGTFSGAYVRDLDSGEELFGLRADRARIPASVEKLFTTSTALLRLGPTATLQTTAVTAPEVVVDSNGVLRGDLVLVGAGDPLFGDEAAVRLAQDLKQRGVKRIDGAVVGDESVFDARRSGRYRGYDPDLGGVLSALAYDRGIFRGRAQLHAGRHAAQRFSARLRRLGIESSARSRAGTAPAGAVPIALADSPDIAELARFVNVPSNNFAAEMLLKVLGARFAGGGSLANGAAVVRDTLDDFGVTPEIADGSGLSRANRVTPRGVVDLLDRIRDEDIALPFRSSLAIAGRTGTVARRMRRTPASGRCRVKTGTLRDVSALAGYCRARGGRDVGFALMFNRVYPGGAKAIEDRIAAAIARLSSAPAPQVPPDVGGAVPEPAAAG